MQSTLSENWYQKYNSCCSKKRRSRTTNSETNNGTTPFLNGNSEQLCLHRQLREEGSVATCMTSLDDDEKL